MSDEPLAKSVYLPAAIDFTQAAVAEELDERTLELAIHAQAADVDLHVAWHDAIEAERAQRELLGEPTKREGRRVIEARLLPAPPPEPPPPRG